MSATDTTGMTNDMKALSLLEPDDEDRGAAASNARQYLTNAIECLKAASRTHDIAPRVRIMTIAQWWIEQAAEATRPPSCRDDDHEDGDNDQTIDPGLGDT